MNDYNKVTEIIRQVEANETVAKELQKLIESPRILWQPEVNIIKKLII